MTTSSSSKPAEDLPQMIANLLRALQSVDSGQGGAAAEAGPPLGHADSSPLSELQGALLGELGALGLDAAVRLLRMSVAKTHALLEPLVASGGGMAQAGERPNQLLMSGKPGDTVRAHLLIEQQDPSAIEVRFVVSSFRQVRHPSVELCFPTQVRPLADIQSMTPPTSTIYLYPEERRVFVVSVRIDPMAEPHLIGDYSGELEIHTSTMRCVPLLVRVLPPDPPSHRSKPLDPDRQAEPAARPKVRGRRHAAKPR